MIASVAFTWLNLPAGYAGTANLHEKLPQVLATKLVSDAQLEIVVPLNIRVTALLGLNPEPFAVELLVTSPAVGKRVSVGESIVKPAVP